MEGKWTMVVFHSSAFYWGGSSLALTLGFLYWWRKPLSALFGGSRRGGKKTQTGETKSLLEKSSRTKQIIARYETQVAQDTKQHSHGRSKPSTTTTSPKSRPFWEHVFSFLWGSNKQEPKQVIDIKAKESLRRPIDRCACCRKVLVAASDDTAATTLTHQNRTLHRACCVCRDCGVNLADEIRNVTMQTSNGKVRFVCDACVAVSDHRDVYAKPAGERTVVDQKGNVHQVLGEIGDDLEQAVYFMTPRCATCGGDLQQAYDKEGKAGIRVVGRTVYHALCFETGRPAAHVTAPAVKLPPSFCAKYLPEHIILKLVHDKTTLTTLYFCWKDRAAEAEALRRADEACVSVQLALDDQAPANPNYIPTSKDNGKRKKPTKRVPLHFDDVKDVQVQLVPGSQVPPRVPRMPQPALLKDGSYWTAELVYLHFGLQYRLIVCIPHDASEQSLRLVEAGLTLTIQDWQ